ncbi:GNAT family N-acetyltransferase [Thalassococcus sp. BH17M4-6]|uniref:GNAT family N-acetyltransferase n=1 Tax=Thalassococcus sp. BH17M4-6 TaxID=3413148 RepID=UPI003BE49687
MTPPIPLLQSPEFARTLTALGLPVRRHQGCFGPGSSAVWQVQSRRLAVLGPVDLISRGPVWDGPPRMAAWLQALPRSRPLILNAGTACPNGLRDAGFWPLITPASLAILDLQDPTLMRAALHQKWRNRLVRAEGAGLQVTQGPLSPGHWLLSAEVAQQRSKRYRGLPAGTWLPFAMANPGKAQVVEARDRDGPVAAALILRHGAMATYQIGVSTDSGRRSNAMNLVLWRAICALADVGVRQLDLGAVNTDDAPGLARFKLGTGAQIHRLGGTWLYARALAPLACRLPERLAA